MSLLPAIGLGSRPCRVWLRWSLGLALVLAAHGSALLLLRRTVPAIGVTAPEAIMIDLAPEPAAPEPAPPTPVPEQAAPAPPEPPPPEPVPPDPVPPPELPPPDRTPPLIPDVIPPTPQAEVPLPAPRPVVRPPPRRPRPAVAKAAPDHAPAEAQPAAPMAAPPGPAAAAPSGQTPVTWEAQLLAHLARFKHFPPAAQRRGEQGVVLMRLTITRAGSVLASSMVRGSGYADLDQEAQAWMARAAPLPALPPEITAAQIQIVVPLRFIMR